MNERKDEQETEKKDEQETGDCRNCDCCGSMCEDCLWDNEVITRRIYKDKDLTGETIYQVFVDMIDVFEDVTFNTCNFQGLIFKNKTFKNCDFFDIVVDGKGKKNFQNCIFENCEH